MNPAKPTRITLTCNECGKTWKAAPSSDPQCPGQMKVKDLIELIEDLDYEIAEAPTNIAIGARNALAHYYMEQVYDGALDALDESMMPVFEELPRVGR